MTGSRGSPRRATVPVLILLAATLSGLCAEARAEILVPQAPPAHLVDLAGAVPGGQAAQIEGVLRDLERRSSAQVVVLAVPTLGGEAIEPFSLRVAELWRLGQKGKDNGLLLTVAIKERRYRFEVGYGLEAVLPDSFVGTLGRETLVPAFKAGDFGGGLLKVVGAIASRLESPPAPSPPPRRAGLLLNYVVTAALGAAFCAYVFVGVRNALRRKREARSSRRVPGPKLGRGSPGSTKPGPAPTPGRSPTQGRRTAQPLAVGGSAAAGRAAAGRRASRARPARRPAIPGR